MKRNILVIVLCFIILFSHLSAQNLRYYRVWLTDKTSTHYTLDQPHAFLSEKSLTRRAKLNIAIDSTDLPVNPDYLAQIEAKGGKIIQVSKWLNTALVAGNQSMADEIQKLPFVKQYEWVGGKTNPEDETAKDRLKRVLGIQSTEEDIFNVSLTQNTGESVNTNPEDLPYYHYGEAERQITLMRGHVLHEKGFRGQGMTIAVIDGGFVDVDSCPAFDHLRQRGKIIATRNLWTPDTLPFYRNPSNHGAMVLSCMGSFLPGKIVGTAPLADYILIRSEVGSFEEPVEEDLWVAAAEYADSLGADILNTSLGYTTYDPPFPSYTYSSLDGKTAYISRGADIAATKGMLVINSAGNSGNKKWYHIGVPADAENVFSVAAIDSAGMLAPFSSRGSTYDCRLKPNISAMGVKTICMVGNEIMYPNGTSFSSPILSGMITCLWQAFPEASPEIIKNAVMKTASMKDQPNVEYGYGIPDFEKAYQYLRDKMKKNNSIEQK